jgi:hypothetical protein
MLFSENSGGGPVGTGERGVDQVLHVVRALVARARKISGLRTVNASTTGARRHSDSDDTLAMISPIVSIGESAPRLFIRNAVDRRGQRERIERHGIDRRLAVERCRQRRFELRLRTTAARRSTRRRINATISATIATNQRNHVLRSGMLARFRGADGEARSSGAISLALLLLPPAPSSDAWPRGAYPPAAPSTKWKWLLSMTDGTMHVISADACRCKPKRATPSGGGALQLALDPVGDRRRAIERHPQVVVVLAEIGILDDLRCSARDRSRRPSG